MKIPGQTILQQNNNKPQAGRWEARTGALRFVKREIVVIGGDISGRILQQEFAVIERDNHGIEKRSFEWHDVPLMEE
jgi:hypothetical protein